MRPSPSFTTAEGGRRDDDRRPDLSQAGGKGAAEVAGAARDQCDHSLERELRQHPLRRVA